MRCVMCNKEMDKVAHWVGGHPIGPKCYLKKFGASLKIAHEVVKLEQTDLFGELNMSYAEIELNVVRWGEARGIVQNSNNMAQAIKTLEEVGELLEAIHKGDRAAQIDAYGDILVTLVIGCATADLDLVTCFESAYQQIKDRKGHLDSSGVFIKE